MFSALTPETITLAAGALLSALFILFPPARAWFTAKDGDTQRAFTGGVLLLVALLTVGASCTGLVPSIACNVTDVGGYFTNVVLAAVLGLGASKGVFGLRKVAGSRSASRGLLPTTGKLLD